MKASAAITDIIVRPQLRPYSTRSSLNIGLQIVEDVYCLDNRDKMTDLTDDVADFTTEPVAARLPTDTTGSLQFGSTREVDELKVIEWQMMKSMQERLMFRSG